MKKKKILILEKINEKGINLLKKKFDVNIELNLSKKDINQKIKNYHIIIIKSTTIIDNKLLGKAKKLELIGRAGTGLDNINLKLLKKKKLNYFIHQMLAQNRLLNLQLC